MSTRQGHCGHSHLRIQFKGSSEGRLRQVGETERLLGDSEKIVTAGRLALGLDGSLECRQGRLVFTFSNKYAASRQEPTWIGRIGAQDLPVEGCSLLDPVQINQGLDQIPLDRTVLGFGGQQELELGSRSFFLTGGYVEEP